MERDCVTKRPSKQLQESQSLDPTCVALYAVDPIRIASYHNPSLIRKMMKILASTTLALVAIQPGTWAFHQGAFTPVSTRSVAGKSSTFPSQPHQKQSWQSQHHRNFLQSALSMSVEGDFDADAIVKAREEAQSGSVKAKAKALYKFTRPHTIRGTILASFAGTTRALIDTPGAIANANWGYMLPRAFIEMFALLLGNAFIVGINQIYDEDIDKMNKPFLPVASGEMSKRFAWAAVVLSGVVGPILVNSFFPPLLFQLYSFGLFLGLVYSVPPIRTKQNPILAGLTIACVRGFLLNFGVYYAVKNAIGSTFSWSPKVSFVARFMTIFASIIAITKDLPDVEGDKVR